MCHISIYYGNIFLFFDEGVGACSMGTMASPGLVWSPHYVKDKVLIEKIQRRFTRMIPRLKNLQYEDRLRELKLWTLEGRRVCADLTEVFKIIKQPSSIKLETFLN